MPSPRFRDLSPELQPYANWLYDYAAGRGWRPVVTSTFRSIQKQATLYDRYRRGLSELPAAPPGRSLHNYGLAFDMVLQRGWRGTEQRELGAVWRSIGGQWFESDPVHFQPRVTWS